jgi:hypothetical protein
MLKQRLRIYYDPTKPGGLSAERVYNVKHDDAVAYTRTRSLDLQPGAVLFYLPNVTVTRFKIKAFSDKFGVSTTKQADKADYIIINDGEKSKTMRSLSNQQVQYTRYFILNEPKEYRLIQYVADPKSKIYDPEFIQVLDESKGLEMIMSDQDAEKHKEYIHQQTGQYVWYHYGYTEKNFISLSNPSLYSKLRHQDDITPLINQDAIIITDEKRVELQRMFDSMQNDNIVLAMEIMANSNYEESILNNYLLIVTNTHKINNQRESGHKNFVALLAFYGINLKYMSSRITNSGVDEISGMLKEYGQLTEENMQKLLAYYAEQNNQYVGNYCNSKLVPNSDIEYDGHE